MDLCCLHSSEMLTQADVLQMTGGPGHELTHQHTAWAGPTDVALLPPSLSVFGMSYFNVGQGPFKWVCVLKSPALDWGERVHCILRFAANSQSSIFSLSLSLFLLSLSLFLNK